MWRPGQLAERLADELLVAARVPAIAPVDIAEVAERLGASPEPRELRQDGRLVPQGATAKIWVRHDQPRCRQRFTIAHELAHWAVRSPALRSERALETQEAFRSEELMCNAVAGALLMPTRWVRATVPNAQHEQDLAQVQHLAQLADVSLAAAVVRLRDLFGWRRTLLHWTRIGEEWIFDGEAGVFPWEQGLIIPADSASSVLLAASVEGEGIDGWPLPLMIGALEDDFWGEVLVRGDNAVALIELPRNLDAASSSVETSAFAPLAEATA